MMLGRRGCVGWKFSRPFQRSQGSDSAPRGMNLLLLLFYYAADRRSPPAFPKGRQSLHSNSLRIRDRVIPFFVAREQARQATRSV